VSVLDDLKEVVVKGRPLGKLHALWTLEGLGHEDPEIFLEALKAKDPVVAQTALRLVVNLASDQPELKQKIEEFLMADYDRAAPILQMQMVIASSSITSDNAFSLAEKFLETYGEYPVARDVVMSSLEDREEAMLTHLLSGNEWREQSQNKQIFFEMLASAIVNKGKVTETDRLFAILQNKKNPADLWIKTAIANGMGNAERKKDSSMIMLKNRPALFEDPDGLSAELQPLLGRIQDRFSWPGKRHDTVPAADRAENIHPGVFAVGRQKYLNLCANCHGMQGEGMRRFAPPLKNSEWVTGEDYKLAMILLHGMEGPVTVDGKLYDTPDILPSMPSFTTLQNEDIAAIATYIRNSWGNSQSEISPGTIGRIRYRTQGKIQPWTASELDTVAFDQEL
jgi:mono/diheme cytochrome c family protein